MEVDIYKETVLLDVLCESGDDEYIENYGLDEYNKLTTEDLDIHCKEISFTYFLIIKEQILDMINNGVYGYRSENNKDIIYSFIE